MKHAPSPGVVTALAVVALIALSAPASAQNLAQGQAQLPPRAQAFAGPRLPSPLRDDGVDALTGLPALRVDAARVAALAAFDAVTLADLPLPGGAVDLELEQVDLRKLRFGWHVDGAAAPGLADGLELSVWTGHVAGDPSREAVIGFSTRGVSGWVGSGDGTVHLMGRPGAGNDWAASSVVVARDAELAARGLEPGDLCALDTGVPLRAGEAFDAPPLPRSYEGAQADGTRSCDVWEGSIAVETDFQYFEKFNDLGAATAYMTTLLASISARYEEQVQARLVFPYVMFHTTAADPWSTPDVPGSSGDMLGELQAAWAGNIPANADIGHMISGADLGGGVAYLGVLCETSHTFTFAVSGNMHGQTPFPIAVGPLNWDFMVVAHETGHNYGSPHTHDYSPPIDQCAFGTCTDKGTIMSYCHICDGGLSNITTYFNEPFVTGVIKAHVAACLPYLAPLQVDETAQPSIVSPTKRSTVVVQLVGSPLSAVDLLYRTSPSASFDVLPMTPTGGGTWSGNLPPPSCGDAPEWAFAVLDQECGAYQTPSSTAEVGDVTTLLFDDFEADAGWTVGAPEDDATTGVWERGDPIGTGVQPEDDVTAGGSICWFTGQGTPGGSIGENDVDGGRTTLVAPAVALDGHDARLSFWLWYSNGSSASPNADIFEVEVSVDGGPWTNVLTVGPGGEGVDDGWVRHEVVLSAHVQVGNEVQARFIASDEGSGSVVEAALDEFEVFRVECGRTCQPDLGFGGPGGAVLSVCGGDLSNGSPATLDLTGAVPHGTAVLVAGGSFGPTPFKGGTLVPVPWFVAVHLALDGAGALAIEVPGGAGPMDLYLQAFYADAGQPLGFGISNAVEMQLLP